MQKTENLELNIIDGTDVPSHAVFNENFNKLDNFAKETNNNETSLTNRFNSLENSVNETVTTLENSVNKKVTALEKKVDDAIIVLKQEISETEIEVDGETKKGKLKKLVIKTTPNYTSFIQSIAYGGNDFNEKRCLIQSYKADGNVNMTSLVGLTDVKDILLTSTQIYSDVYKSATSLSRNTIPVNVYSLQKLSNPLANDDIYITYGGDSTTFTLQEYNGTIWAPSPSPTPPTSDVYIVINYIEFNK